MHVRITCPRCGVPGEVRREHVGCRVVCKRCRMAFEIAAPRRPPASAAGAGQSQPLWARLAKNRLVAAAVVMPALAVVLALLLGSIGRREAAVAAAAPVAAAEGEAPAEASTPLAAAAEPPEAPSTADDPLAPAVEDPFARAEATLAIDRAGDALFALELQLPAQQHARLRKSMPNAALWPRQLGLGRGWPDVEDVRTGLEDDTDMFSISYVVRGLARVREGDDWEARLAEDPDAQLIAVRENMATLVGGWSLDGGRAPLCLDVELPAGSKDVRLLRAPTRLRYRLPAAADAPPRPGGQTATVEKK